MFSKAQSIEPTYPLSWIGQAIIADKIKRNEMVDLYRHATTIGSHVSLFYKTTFIFILFFKVAFNC